MISVPNWDSLQHYKHRRPPWIKLYQKLLDNKDWAALPDRASKLLVECWLLASKNEQAGIIGTDSDDIAWSLRRPKKQVAADLQVLEEYGFIDSASTALASCKQNALSEKSRDREEKRQREKILFDEFWAIAVRPVGVLDAKKAFEKAINRPDSEQLMDRWRAFNKSVKGKDKEFIPHPSTWLNQGRWLDTPAKPKAKPDADGAFYG